MVTRISFFWGGVMLVFSIFVVLASPHSQIEGAAPISSHLVLQRQVDAAVLRSTSILGSVVDTTTSIDFVNFTLPNMAVSITTNKNLQVDFSAYIAGSTAGSVVEIQLVMDGTALPGSIRGFTTGVANAQATIGESYLISPVAPGNHTIYAQWRTTGIVATTTIGGNRQLSVAEMAV